MWNLWIEPCSHLEEVYLRICVLDWMLEMSQSFNWVDLWCWMSEDKHRKNTLERSLDCKSWTVGGYVVGYVQYFLSYRAWKKTSAKASKTARTAQERGKCGEMSRCSNSCWCKKQLILELREKRQRQIQHIFSVIVINRTILYRKSWKEWEKIMWTTRGMLTDILLSEVYSE